MCSHLIHIKVSSVVAANCLGLRTKVKGKIFTEKMHNNDVIYIEDPN